MVRRLLDGRLKKRRERAESGGFRRDVFPGFMEGQNGRGKPWREVFRPRTAISQGGQPSPVIHHAACVAVLEGP